MNTIFLEEKEGFEPSVGYDPTPDFESGTFDHSATSPFLVDLAAGAAKRMIIAETISLRKPYLDGVKRVNPAI